MRNKATLLVYMVLILLISFPAFGGNKFINICSDPSEREKVIKQHTKRTFPEYANDSIALENLMKKTREYVNKLCADIGKRAFHGSWHPEPFDFGKIIGVAYFTKGQNLGYIGQTADRDDFYYIIEEGGDSFVSRCSRVNPK